MMKPKKTTTFINNKKARYDYYIDDIFRAGIVLTGSEVKSIRAGHANISEAFCYFNNGELFLKNSYVSAWTKNKIFGHEEIHDRKLLLSKKELRVLKKSVEIKGITIIPLSIEVPAYGYIKVNIALCRGKHNYDKRQAIKENDYKKELRYF